MLIAHNAASEARLLFDYRQYCPNLARIDFLDTVKLARDLYPELSRHGLDSLLPYLGIARSPHRHRAMADVHATVEVFITMIASGRWSNLSQLRHVAHYSAKASQPEQISLFS